MSEMQADAKEERGWGTKSDLPVFFVDPTAETAIAFEAGLRELFRQYPPRQQYSSFMSGVPTVDVDSPVEWRDKALHFISHGSLTAALLYADGTGVPREELLALAMLLGARAPDPEG